VTSPSPLELLIDGIINATVSHAAASGYFESVNAGPPVGSPSLELTCALWVQRIRPIPSRSSLIATTGMVVLNTRLYMGMVTEPQDYIDPKMTKATSALMAAYTGDFTFGGQVSNLDLLGAHGFPLEALAGYQTIGTIKYRVMTIQVPCVVNDMFIQAP